MIETTFVENLAELMENNLIHIMIEGAGKPRKISRPRELLGYSKILLEHEKAEEHQKNKRL